MYSVLACICTFVHGFKFKLFKPEHLQLLLLDILLPEQ